MPTYFPCPNTQCSYQFDADILPPAAMVTCPLCRTKFPYRANRPVPTPAAVGGGGTDGPTAPVGSRVVSIREVPQGGGPLSIILWIAGTVAVLGTLTAVLVVWSGKQAGFMSQGDVNGEQSDPKFNLKLDAYPSGYQEDVQARETLKANIFARKRTGPDGWTAMAAKDLKDRNARPAELDEMIRTRLRDLLTSPNILDSEPGETWAGQPARSIAFSGDWDGNQMKGHALAITYQGYAYAFFAWASERDWDGLKGELLGLKDKFHFLSPRADWVPRVGDTVTYEGPGYQLENDGAWVMGKPTDQWKPKEKPRYEVDNVKEIDPAGVMALKAAYQPKAGGDARRHQAVAYALVVELSKGGNPLEVAKEHVTDRIHREFGGKVNADLESVAGPVPLPTGGPAIGRFRFRSPIDKTDRTVWIVSAIQVGGKVVAVEIKTREQDATYVEEWMVRLAASLKAK